MRNKIVWLFEEQDEPESLTCYLVEYILGEWYTWLVCTLVHAEELELDLFGMGETLVSII